MTHTYANHWFQKLSANAIGMINQRIGLKKHGLPLTKLGFDQNKISLKPELEAFRYEMHNDIKMRAQLARQRSTSTFRIRKLSSLENKKQSSQRNH